ncbi:MAG: c-type cytochrome [Anaerolineae bacterium]
MKPGDPDRGQRLFVTLPCAGCHGATAGGQFGPTLAGTSLALSAVEEQVRRPRDKMPPFAEAVVSEDDLRDIYAWLTSLAPPQAAAAGEKAPAEATAAALDRRFPELDAEALGLMMGRLDEVSLRVAGEVVELESVGRFARARLRVGDGPQAMDLLASFDTTLAGGPFPAEVGDVVVAYGVGADPAKDSSGTLLPRMQILELEVGPS